ncbi:hypothetical protein [Fulvimarina sp. MAC8]|uniref:hypothetical protein n=1 Tax=Fulvimarina sp. MAC8 TaxID=3162874 RepID=UPI0032EFCD54
MLSYVHLSSLERERIAGRLRGGVENDNGRLRGWLPRSLDLDTISETDLQDMIVSFSNETATMRRLHHASPAPPQRAWQVRPNPLLTTALPFAMEFAH